MINHYTCNVLSRTGQPMEQKLLQPGFYDAQCLYWGWPIDAPETLNTGSVRDATPPFAYNWTQGYDFVMRAGA